MMTIIKKARFEITERGWHLRFLCKTLFIHFFATNELKFQPSTHAIICTTKFKYQVRGFCPIIQKEKDVAKKT